MIAHDIEADTCPNSAEGAVHRTLTAQLGQLHLQLREFERLEFERFKGEIASAKSARTIFCTGGRTRTRARR